MSTIDVNTQLVKHIDLINARAKIVRNVCNEYNEKEDLMFEFENMRNLSKDCLEDLVARHIEACINVSIINSDTFEKFKHNSTPLDVICSKYRNVYKFSWDDIRRVWKNIYDKCKSLSELKLDDYKLHDAQGNILEPGSDEYEKRFEKEKQKLEECKPKIKEVLRKLRAIDEYPHAYTYSFDDLEKELDEESNDDEHEKSSTDYPISDYSMDQIEFLFKQSIDNALSTDPPNYKMLIEIIYEAHLLAFDNYWDEDMAKVIQDKVIDAVSSRCFDLSREIYYDKE